MWHVSDIKKFERCNKLMWLSKKQPQKFVPYIFLNENIYDLSKQLLRISNYFEGSRNEGNDAFFAHEQAYDSFINVRFEFHTLRVKVPIMLKGEKGYRIYFLFSSCRPKEGEAQCFADTLWVLNNLGIHVEDVYAIHLDAQYVRKKQLDVDELLIINDHLFNEKNHKGRSIAHLIRTFYRDCTPVLNKMTETMNLEEINKKRTSVCTRRNKCNYFNTCFQIEEQDTSILNLVSCSSKFQMYESGIMDIKDVDITTIEGTRHQLAQIIAAQSNELVFDTFAVESFFKDVTYPISYLDFEWEAYAYPPYVGMKPYDVLTFQYSLHIESSEHTLVHKEYLGRRDCRVEFIERLIQDVPKQGSIMCFNVDGAEKLRLTQLADQFPQYKTELKQIWERMIDLSIPFSSGLIYDNKMAGTYNLKTLVSIFTDYNYADLDISHGMDAVKAYRMMDEATEEQEWELKQLLAYCAMDTYAEYLIYHFILNEIQKEYKQFRR